MARSRSLATIAGLVSLVLLATLVIPLGTWAQSALTGPWYFFQAVFVYLVDPTQV